ncbi:GntR family transcriptional regulator [Klebsiella michiganensis]|nr:GntR family transcriptional regulator [Klebsiella michiganensis]
MFESDGLPLYLRIKDVILQRILSFTYDDKLPGELLLAGEFKVARGTIKQAIDSLVPVLAWCTANRVKGRLLTAMRCRNTTPTSRTY